MTKTPKIRKTAFKALDKLVMDVIAERDFFKRRHFENISELNRRDRIISDLNVEIGRLMGKDDTYE